MKYHHKIWIACLLTFAGLLPARTLFAHPMGNFSINHYTRLTVHADRIEGRFVLDIAEIPTVTEMSRLDANQDGSVTDMERAEYLREMAVQLSRDLTLTINERPAILSFTPLEMAFIPGAGGLKTLRLSLDFTAELPSDSAIIPLRVFYKDANYPTRTGWKEIVVVENAAILRDSSMPSTDLSNELTVYPSDPAIAPPQVTEARFVVESDKGKGESGKEESQSLINKPNTQHLTPNTRYDSFTQSIAANGLTPMVVFVALLSAFGFGALHALSPGHGKAMVAAYLIGTRGTAWHAVLLGLVVTITHTLGVFALGLITLSASRYIVPERLYPIISALSGIAVAAMGAGLLWHRARNWRLDKSKRGNTAEGEQPDSQADEGKQISANEDEFYTQRRTSGPMPLRTLIGLGITGGALPCPSALVVMLSAIALHRIGFGLLLIVSFSLGLAVVLMLLGLLVMRARGLMERVSPGMKWMPGLSVLSAAAVMLIGLLLLFRSLTGTF